MLSSSAGVRVSALPITGTIFTLSCSSFINSISRGFKLKGRGKQKMSFQKGDLCLITCSLYMYDFNLICTFKKEMTLVFHKHTNQKQFYRVHADTKNIVKRKRAQDLGFCLIHQLNGDSGGNASAEKFQKHLKRKVTLKTSVAVTETVAGSGSMFLRSVLLYAKIIS